MGFWRLDPIEEETVRLEQALHYAQTDEERDTIKVRLSEMYKLISDKRSNKMHITGDGIMKCLTAIGLAAVGYFVESNGGIIPSWAKQKP